MEAGKAARETLRSNPDVTDEDLKSAALAALGLSLDIPGPLEDWKRDDPKPAAVMDGEVGAASEHSTPLEDLEDEVRQEVCAGGQLEDEKRDDPESPAAMDHNVGVALEPSAPSED